VDKSGVIIPTKLLPALAIAVTLPSVSNVRLIVVERLVRDA
jgi:hypothetical protein